MSNTPETPYNGASIEISSQPIEQDSPPSFNPEQFSPEGPVRPLLNRRTRIKHGE